jgi:tetratricopeptide (TPR) repeat protein
MRLKLLVTTWLIATVPQWVAPGVAAAQESKADVHARRAFKKGKSLFQAGRHLEALAQFSAGYELSRRPLFLFNMGECARKLGEPDRARSYYERYIAEDPSGPLVVVAKQRLAELGPSPAPAQPPPAAPAGPETSPAAKPATAPHDVASTQANPSGPAIPRAASSPAPDLRVRESAAPQSTLALGRDEAPDSGRPLWKKWPFWAGVGLAVVTGVVVAVSLNGGDECEGNCVDLRD